ncbi:MAG: hypothetical protein PHS14_04810 [Elusimicrobia bacterium]|nr:hypothetical protein [Elusimicrobiota bacterium]
MRNTIVLSLAVLLASTAAAQTPVVAAGTGRTRTLADVARERKLGIKGVQGGTLSVAGAPVEPAGMSMVRRQAPAGAAVGPDEVEWTRRNAEARGELASARGALAEAEAALPVVNVGTRPNAVNVILQQQRDAALLQYRTRARDAQAKVDALPEAARKAGAEPGWVR